MFSAEIALEDPCSSDADCPAVNSECFKGKCLCSPGYYYSNCSNTCLQGMSVYYYDTSKIPGFARESMTSYSGRYVIIQCPYVPAWSTSLFVHGVSYVYLQIKLLPTLQDQKYDMPYDVKEPRVRSSLLPISYLYSKCVSSPHYPSQPLPPLPPPPHTHTHFLPTPSPHPLVLN